MFRIKSLAESLTGSLKFHARQSRVCKKRLASTLLITLGRNRRRKDENNKKSEPKGFGEFKLGGANKTKELILILMIERGKSAQ